MKSLSKSEPKSEPKLLNEIFIDEDGVLHCFWDNETVRPLMEGFRPTAETAEFDANPYCG